MLGSAQVEQLNKDCYCFPVDTEALRSAIASSKSEVGHLLGVNPKLQSVQDEPQPELRLESRSNLFANTGVLLATAEVDAMMSVITAIETLVGLSAFRADKLESDPELNKWRCGQGALMGYDFHLGAAGPRLIEINTNAGGAFIVNEMMSYCDQVLPECCGFYSPAYEHENLKNLLKSEWQTSGRQGMPAVAAIVDNDPQSQYLYPDMLIAKNYFEQCGVETIVTDVAALNYKEGTLSCNGKKIDLVYNRSTDFTMADENHTALRDAALADAVLVGPNPVHHALYANKRNFLDLVDQKKLEQYDLAPQHREILQEHVPPHSFINP